MMNAFTIAATTATVGAGIFVGGSLAVGLGAHPGMVAMKDRKEGVNLWMDVATRIAPMHIISSLVSIVGSIAAAVSTSGRHQTLWIASAALGASVLIGSGLFVVPIAKRLKELHERSDDNDEYRKRTSLLLDEWIFAHWIRTAGSIAQACLIGYTLASQ